MSAESPSLLRFEEARTRLLAGVRRLGSERVPLVRAAGRVLAEDLVARSPLPPFDHSAMDGYAVATADLPAGGPWRLAVAGAGSAGSEPPVLPPGAACRIFTGAPLPARADAVVMQEHVTREGDAIRFDVRPKPAQHVRRAGEDLTAGAVALSAGTRLSAGSLALAAMLDRSEVVVARRPRVIVVCTGDELRAPGDLARPASIPESNSAPLCALARQTGAAVSVAPIVRDDAGATERALREALGSADVLLTVGGVSVGDHDIVRPALERAGVTIDFWRVAIKPGKPLAVGRREAAHVLGLPGNPASAMVTFALFAAPLLRALQGDSRPVPTLFRVPLTEGRRRTPDRLELVRATLEVVGGALCALCHENQASGAATNLAHSDGIAFLPQGEGKCDAGTLVDFARWSDV
jgi:molybdopterin molybdotransferase